MSIDILGVCPRQFVTGLNEDEEPWDYTKITQQRGCGSSGSSQMFRGSYLCRWDNLTRTETNNLDCPRAERTEQDHRQVEVRSDLPKVGNYDRQTGLRTQADLFDR